jgi:alkylmercury lyase
MSSYNDMTKTVEKANTNVKQVFDIVSENLTPEQEQRRILGQTLKLIEYGNPVRPNEIAIDLQASPDKVISTVRRFGAEFDQDGNIVGLGLTLVPTPHVYKVNGRTLYTWCAVDALTFPRILKHTASIESNDPVTGEKIHIILTPDTVEKIKPKDAVVSFVKNIDLTSFRSSFCNNTNFFSSLETGSKWIARHPGTILYPVNELYQALKHSDKYIDIRMEPKRERMGC